MVGLCFYINEYQLVNKIQLSFALNGGICGEIRYNDSKPDPQSIYAMMNSMATRGPEEEGMILYDTMAFGHRRLKIIDLSEHSKQPMSDSHLGFDIVFNGAIYNCPDLRNKLEQKGYTFFQKEILK